VQGQPVHRLYPPVYLLCDLKEQCEIFSHSSSNSILSRNINLLVQYPMYATVRYRMENKVFYFFIYLPIHEKYLMCQCIGAVLTERNIFASHCLLILQAETEKGLL
jgi:hypothetical protein